MELYEQVAELRKKVAQTPLSETADTIQLYLDFLQSLADLAQEHLDNHFSEWENALLAKEFMDFAPQLTSQPAHIALVGNCALRLVNSFEEHPRLRVRLLRYLIELHQQYPALEISDDAYLQEIKTLERSIKWADEGKMEKLNTDFAFKVDPVEWTAAWEAHIDEVYRQMEQLMSQPDFVIEDTLHFWELKSKLLKEQGIDWKSPAAMNPDLDFC